MKWPNLCLYFFLLLISYETISGPDGKKKILFPPPKNMSEKGRELWGLFITDPPLLQFGNLENREAFVNDFLSWPEDFLAHSEVKKRIKNGQMFYRREIERLRKEMKDAGIMPSTRVSLYKEAILSLEKRAHPEELVKNPYGEEIAKKRALADLSMSKESDLVFHPELRPHYKKLVQKNMPPSPPGKRKKTPKGVYNLTPSEFEKWKQEFIENMAQKLMRANQEFFQFVVGRGLPHMSLYLYHINDQKKNYISTGTEEAIAMLNQLKIGLLPPSFSSGGVPNAVRSYRPQGVDLKGDIFTLALVTVLKSGDPDTLFYDRPYATNRLPLGHEALLQALKKERLKLNVYFEDTRVKKRWMDTQNINEFLAAVKSIEEELKLESPQRENARPKQPFFQLFMDGMERGHDGPLYWEKREEYARRNNLFAIDLKNPSKDNRRKGTPSISLYDSKEDALTESGPKGRKLSQGKGQRLYMSSFAKTSNLAEDKKKSAKNKALRPFKVTKPHESMGIYFAVPKEEESKEVDRVKMPSINEGNKSQRPRVDLESTELIEVSERKMMPLPAPLYHDLDSLKITTASGRALTEGQDFEVHRTQNKTHYLIKYKGLASEAKVQLKISFAPREAWVPNNHLWHNISAEKIRPILVFMEEAGMSKLVKELASLIEKTKDQNGRVSILPFDDIFSKHSYYAEKPLTALEQNLIPANNPFKEDKKFIAFDTVCAQCDGSNAIFTKFINLLYKDNPDIKARSIGLLILDKNGRFEEIGHAITQIEESGHVLSHMDATASTGTDPRIKGLKKLLKRYFSRPASQERLFKDQTHKDKNRVATGGKKALVEDKKLKCQGDQCIMVASEDLWIKSYIAEIKEKRQRVLDAFEPYRYTLKKENTDIKGGPMRQSLRLTRTLIDYLDGALTSEQAIQIIKKDYPALASVNVETKKDVLHLFEKAVMAMRDRIDNRIKFGEKKVRQKVYASNPYGHYTSGAAQTALDDLLGEIKRPYHALSLEQLHSHHRFQRENKTASCYRSALTSIILREAQ